MKETKDMPATVHVAPRNISAQDVAKLMAARGVSAIVVVDDHKPVGIVTSRDILVRTIAARVDAAKVTVGTIMSTPLVTVAEDGSVPDAIALMGRHGIRRLPVVDQAGGLVALLTLDDLLRRNLADAPAPTGIAGEHRRRADDAAPAVQGTRFADVSPPSMLPKPLPQLAPIGGTIGRVATRAVMVKMVARKPLHRFRFSAKTWYVKNRLFLALLVGVSIMGVAITFYVSAFYGYKPTYYEPKEDSREIRLKQMELQELQQKQTERDRPPTDPAR